MLIPWILLVVLNLLDIWTTYRFLETGAGREGNPVAGWLIDNNWLVEAKLLCLALIGAFLFVVNRKRSNVVWAKRAMWTVTGGYGFVVGWNFLSGGIK